MTNTALADIATEIDTLSADLAKVNATIDLIGKPAETKAKQISAALDDAKERFAVAITDQATEERNQRLSRFSDMRVETRAGDNLCTTTFEIHYMQNTWDMALKESIPKPHKCNGFAGLSSDAYEYLLAVKPEAIPAEIMALAPGKPEEAMSVYMAGKARGYFKDRAVAA